MNSNDCAHENSTPASPGVTHSTNGGPEMRMGHCPDCSSEVRQTVATGRWHLVEHDQPDERS